MITVRDFTALQQIASLANAPDDAAIRLELSQALVRDDLSFTCDGYTLLVEKVPVLVTTHRRAAQPILATPQGKDWSVFLACKGTFKPWRPQDPESKKVLLLFQNNFGDIRNQTSLPLNTVQRVLFTLLDVPTA